MCFHDVNILFHALDAHAKLKRSRLFRVHHAHRPLPASPPITTEPAGVSTRYEA